MLTDVPAPMRRGQVRPCLAGVPRCHPRSPPTSRLRPSGGQIEAGLVVEAAADEGAARRQGRPARRFRFRA
ncbi:transcriptional regulator, partial [Streptomyces griseoincarnatus]